MTLSIKAQIGNTVANIFQNKDWKIYATLYDGLPMLAETAPERITPEL
jgi:hypothetical protein